MRGGALTLVCLGIFAGGACSGGLGARLRHVDHLLQNDPSPRLKVADALEDVGLQSEARRYLIRILARIRRRGAMGAIVGRLDRHPWPLFGDAMSRVVARVEGRSFSGRSPRERLALGLLAARYLLRRGARARAARILERLPSDPRVAHLRGMIALARGSSAEALAIFVGARGHAKGPLGDVLTLNAARLMLDAGDLVRARRLYERVTSSSWAPLAREELAWLELRARRPRRVLAILAAIDRMSSPPPADRDLLEALARSELGRAGARRVALRSRRFLTCALKKGGVFLRHRADVRLYYVEATAALARVATVTPRRICGGDGGLPAALQRSLLMDASFRRASAWVQQLQRERRILARPVARGLRARLGARLEARLVRAQTLAGATVRRLLAGAMEELRELRSRTDELLVELDHRAEDRAVSSEKGGSSRR